MLITFEFPHPEYGTLILSGQYNEAEPECNLLAHAVLESVLTYGGEELLQYDAWGPIGFSGSEIREMEDALFSDGEPANRAKPTAETLGFVRNNIINNNGFWPGINDVRYMAEI